MSAVFVQGLVQVTCVVAPVTILLPLVAGSDSGIYGVIIAAEAGGAVVGAAIAAKIAPRRPGLVSMVALLAQLPQTVALALHIDGIVLIPLCFLTGVGLSVFGVLWTTALQVQTPPERLGRVMALDALANSALSPVGIVVVGWFLPIVGVSAVAWVATVMLAVSIVVALPVRGVLEFADPVDALASAGVRQL